MNAKKQSDASLIEKSNAEMASARTAQVRQWADEHRDSDWEATYRDPDQAEAVAALGLVASLDDIISSAPLANSRWRKTIERIRSFEATTGVSIWPTAAPTQPSAARRIMAWMLREPKRIMLFDAAYRREHGESMFKRGAMRLAPTPDRGLDPLCQLLIAIMDYGTPHGVEIRKEIDSIPDGEIPPQVATLRNWLARYMPAGKEGSPYPAAAWRPHAAEAPRKKRGRPTNAELAARREAAEAAEMASGSTETTRAGEEPERPAPVGGQAPTAQGPCGTAAEAPAAHGASQAENAPCEPEGEPDADISDLELAAAEARLAAEEAQRRAEQAQALVEKAKAPVPTGPMRAELDGAWAENGITWPDLVTRSAARKCRTPLRAAVEASASIRAIEAGLSANAERIREIPDDLETLVAELTRAKDERASLKVARHDAAEGLQAILSADLLPPAPEASGCSLGEAPCGNAEPADDALRARIAELESLLAGGIGQSKAVTPEFGPAESASPGKAAAVTIVASLILRSSDSAAAKRSAAIQIVTEWAMHNSKAPLRAVEGISNGGTVRHGQDEIEIAVSPDGSGWALRYTHPDKSVANRHWTAEATVSLRDGTVEVYAKLYTTGDSTAKMTRSRPTFIKNIVALGGWKDGSLDAGSSLIRIDSAQGFDDLVFEPSRRLPVVVVSTQNSSDEPLLDPAALTHDLHGIAHVALIGKQASRDVAARHPTGRFQQWNVYDGAIRVYQPIKDAASANPIDHRYLSTRTIRNSGKANAKRKLIEHALEITARTIHPQGVVEFSQIVESAVSKIQADLLALPADQQSGDSLRDIIARKDEQIEYWKGEFNAANAIMEDESADKRRAQAEKEELSEALRQAKADLAEALAQKNHYAAEASRLALAKSAPAPQDRPFEAKDHAGLVELVTDKIGPGIVVTPACLRDLKKNPQLNIPKMLDCLNLLRSYVDMKHKRISFAEWQQVQDQSRATDCSYSKDTGTLEAYGDYVFTFEGERLIAERHLKIGGDPDIRNTVRVYYTYHEPTRRAVISSMTRHLTVRSTN